MKEVTVSDIIDAIERNGLPKLRYEYFHIENDRVLSACALGQAAYNLGVRASDLDTKIQTIRGDDEEVYRALNTYIVDLNDNNSYSFKEMADKLREAFSNSLNAIVAVEEKEYLK